MATITASIHRTSATSLFIAASFASSGDFPQVSRDITEHLEARSRKPMSLLSAALFGADEDDSCCKDDANEMEELIFEPRLEEEDGEDDLFAPRLHPLSPSSSFDTSPGSSPAKSASSRRSASRNAHDEPEDTLATAFSNIQLVSPTYFQLNQIAASTKPKNNVVTPEELHAKGNYNYDAASVGSGRSRPSSTKSQIRSTNFFGSGNMSSSASMTAARTTATTTTPTKIRNSLSDMVHSVDLSLFPKPLQRLSESPVMARIGSILSGTGSGSSYASANQSVVVGGSGSDDSFHTAHMTEAAMEPSPPKEHHQQESTSPIGTALFSGISHLRKRHHDGTLTVDADAANQQQQQQPLLSPDDIPASTRSKTASSFTANRHPHRIIYRLKDGKRGMSQQSKEALSNFLPRLFNLGKKADPVPPTAAAAGVRTRQPSPQGKKKSKQSVPTKIKTKKEKAPLPEKVYVLLLEMSNKLFEICPIDYVRDMTVGDVLAKVRTNASDPVLAAQKYASLLNSTIEFSAPMLPLSLLLDRNDKKPLLTALPPGTGPDECRRITTILMGHPTLQRFWANEDPFEPSPAKKQRRS